MYKNGNSKDCKSIMNLQDLQQENGTSLTIKIMDNMAEEMRNHCDYSDAYILVTGNITATGNVDTKVAFKNCASFTRCVAHINDEHVETAENVDFIMPMYNLLEYSDNMQTLLEAFISLKDMNKI